MVTPNRPLMEKFYVTKKIICFSNPLWGFLPFLAESTIDFIFLLRNTIFKTGNSHTPVLAFPYIIITNFNFKN